MRDDLEAFAAGLVPLIKDYVARVAPAKGEMMGLQEAFDAGFEAVKKYVDDALDAFEGRLAAVENRGIKYCGVFQRAQTYRKGDVVTDAGSAWVALREVENEKPGDGASWQLMVKAGRDAKDVR
jgi:hypothetical protein